MELTIKVFIVLRARPTRTRNQDWRHSQTRFNTMNSMAVLELANEFLLKIVLFEISTIVSIYVKF